jgi:hypothetical protein
VKPNFSVLKVGDRLRDTETGEIFAVVEIDRETETCAIHAMRMTSPFTPVEITEQIWNRSEILSQHGRS